MKRNANTMEEIMGPCKDCGTPGHVDAGRCTQCALAYIKKLMAECEAMWAEERVLRNA